jgi:hypothetical protein
MNTAEKIQVETGSVACELPIFVCKLDRIAPQLQLARQALDELRASHPESTPSNVQAVYMSPWNSHEINPKLQPLCDAVAAIAQSMAQSAMGVWFSALRMELYVAQCWGIFYEDSDHTLPHSHFPAEFACAIYLEADEGCAPIVFSRSLAIHPEPRSMVLFPGILTHEVPANKGRRVVISMNLFKRPAFALPV